MVKLHKLHKIFGLSAGVVILILGVTGFFLDHDKWSFLYTTTFNVNTDSSQASEKRLWNDYWVDAKNSSHLMACSQRGIYESKNSGVSFVKIFTKQCLAFGENANRLFSATSDGLYKYERGEWKPFALQNNFITALALHQKKIVAVIDKSELIFLDTQTAKILQKTEVFINKEELQEDIKLSRFVRDLHYGRGLFEGDISLLINDYGAIVMSFLALSGFLIWWLIRSKNSAKGVRKLIKYHANVLIIVAFIPITIVAITGVFLDHSQGLRNFMSSTNIPHKVLPPVYDTLQSDIWSVDIDKDVVRIGNRYGVYRSEDLKEWHLESRGFAYSMVRKKDTLYVAGMGAKNRVYENEWHYLKKAPHMFKSVIIQEGKVKYFSSMMPNFPLPKIEDMTLYTFLLTLHDGTFFASWWVWINDFVAFGLMVLGVSGFYRWLGKKRG